MCPGYEENTSPWYTVKERTYYLNNIYYLMKTYMEHNPKNIEPAFDTMAGSGYYPNYNIRGLTDDTCSGKALRSLYSKERVICTINYYITNIKCICSSL